MNEPIYKKVLDILPSRKKDYLMSYLCNICVKLLQDGWWNGKMDMEGEI